MGVSGSTMREGSHSARKSMLFGLIAALAVFFSGFFIMNILWHILPRISGLPGLYYYRAATIGDGLFLPVMVGAAVAFLSMQPSPKKSVKIASGIAGGISALLGAGLQISWLFNADIGVNWTIPRPHYFNLAGWYHAAFFTGMFFVLGILIVRMGASYSTRNYTQFETVCTTLFWGAGSGFLFMLFLDDYSSKIYYTELLLVSLLAFSLFALIFSFVFSRKTIKQYFQKYIQYDVIPVISGIISTFGFAMSLMGQFNGSWLYTISAGLLSVSFINTYQQQLKQVLTNFILIAVPTFMLNLALSTHINNTPIELGILCAASVIIPLLFALIQLKGASKVARKRHVRFGIVLLLMTTFSSVSYLYDLELYQYLLGVVTSFVVGRLVNEYVKMQFDDIIGLEEKYGETMDAAKLISTRETQATTYSSIVFVALGALLFVLQKLMSTAEASKSYEFWIDPHWSPKLSILSVIFCIALMALLVNNAIRNNKGKPATGIYPIVTVVSMIVAYFALAWMLILLREPYYLDINILLLICLVFGFFTVLGVSVLIAGGFQANMSKVFVSASPKLSMTLSIIIFGGVFVTLGLALFPAANSDGTVTASIFKLSVGIVATLAINVLIPALAGLSIRKPLDVPERKLDYSVKGVFQDGFLMTIITWAAGVVPIYFTSLTSYGPKFYFLGVIMIISAFSWPLTYCLTNNVGHLKREVEKTESHLQKYPADNAKEETRIRELSIHLRRQCQWVLVATFPYCLVPMSSKAFFNIPKHKDDDDENGHDDDNFWRDYIPPELSTITQAKEWKNGRKKDDK